MHSSSACSIVCVHLTCTELSCGQLYLRGLCSSWGPRTFPQCVSQHRCRSPLHTWCSPRMHGAPARPLRKAPPHEDQNFTVNGDQPVWLELCLKKSPQRHLPLAVCPKAAAAPLWSGHMQKTTEWERIKDSRSILDYKKNTPSLLKPLESPVTHGTSIKRHKLSASRRRDLTTTSSIQKEELDTWETGWECYFPSIPFLFPLNFMPCEKHYLLKNKAIKNESSAAALCPCLSSMKILVMGAHITRTASIQKHLLLRFLWQEWWKQTRWTPMVPAAKTLSFKINSWKWLETTVIQLLLSLGNTT